MYPKLGIIISDEIDNALLILPIIKQLKNKQNKIKLIVIYEKIEHYSILENVAEIDQFFDIRNPKAFTIFNLNEKVFNPFTDINNSKHSLHIIDQVALNIDCNWFDKNIYDEIVIPEDEAAKKFISKYEFPVIIQPSSKIKIREWNLKKWEIVVSKFPKVTFIQIGKLEDNYIKGTIDLRGKTTIRGALALIKYSKFCIGVDSFINHASFLTKTKGIILFGPSVPTVKGYEQNINLYKYANCSPCRNSINCRENKACLNTITVDDVSKCISNTINNKSSDKKALLVRGANGIGDMLLITPVIRKIKEKYPYHNLTMYYIGEKNNQKILENNPFVDEIINIDSSSKFRKFIQDSINYEFVYEPHYDLTSHLTYIEFLLKKCNITPTTEYKPEIFLSEEEEKKAKLFLNEFKKPVTIQTKSSRHIKDWPFERWESLVRRNKDYTFIHLGDSSAHNIKGTIDMRGKITIREAIAIIKFSKLFIGIDSFMAHACAAVNTPGIVLFGPTSKEDLGYSSNINISKNICIPPCNDLLFDYFSCNLNRKCLNDIKVEDVEDAINLSVKLPNNCHFDFLD
jgi:ADP-heptose:LPS heptosyltransferase